MVISKPQLTAIKGYVEVVDSNGNHIYKPTQETLLQQAMEQRMAEMTAATEQTNMVVDTLIGAPTNEEETPVEEEEVAE